MKRDEWVWVKSESELRPGMAVQARPCRWCGRRETMVLLTSIATTADTFVTADGARGSRGEARAWKTSRQCPKPLTIYADRSVFVGTIRDGRLYRLADWNFDEASDDTTAPVRELVGAETGTTVTKARAGK